MIVIKHKQSSICNILKEYPKSAWNTLDFENGAGPFIGFKKGGRIC